MEEIWKRSDFGCGNYEFSNMGRVRNTKVNKIVKGVPNSRGYLRICNTKTKTRIFIHREVARLFLGECPENMVVNHIDGNPQNNAVTNLEYITQMENIFHSLNVLHKGRILDENLIQSICRDYKNGMRLCDLSDKYNHHRDVIDTILKRHGLKTNKLSHRDNQQPSHKYNYERFNDQ